MKCLKQLISKFLKRCDVLISSTPNLPKGWVETKICDDVNALHIPSHQTEQWGEDRRKEDEVDVLIKRNGFYDRRFGRGGYIYYVEDGHLCEMYYELSADGSCDICLFPINLTEWTIPKSAKIDKEHQLAILNKLQQWLKKQNIRTSINQSLDLTITGQPCGWANCNEKRIKGLAVCQYHHRLSFLVE